MTFDPFQPAVTIASSGEFAVYEQRGEYWFSDQASDFTTKLPEKPGSWWSNDEIIRWAIRKAIAAMPV